MKLTTYPRSRVNVVIAFSRTARRSALIGGISVMLSGCSNLTDVSAPDVVQPSSLANAAGADALRAGAISSFFGLFTGGIRAGTETSIVSLSGVMADEMLGIAGIYGGPDQRIVPEPNTGYLYLESHRARSNAIGAILALQKYAPTMRPKIGELFALVGYTEVFFGEELCSGVPLSEFVDGRPAYGQPLTTQQMFDRANADFDSAVVYAADSVRLLNLARIGKGRALLNMRRFAEASATVSAVPTGYLYVSSNSAAVQPNGMFIATNNMRQVGVSDREGVNGLAFRSENDPRVPTRLIGKGIDNVTDIYSYTRYASAASPVTLASGVEARLIEAEAALQAGNAAQMLVLLNGLRADAGVRAQYAVPAGQLAPLALPATRADQEDLLFHERAFWLFATAHRHGDLRRLVRQYSRPTESVFPTGAFRGGQLYGTDVNYTPDPAQPNNPNYTKCLDRAP
jgi:hypothetical protein